MPDGLLVKLANHYTTRDIPKAREYLQVETLEEIFFPFFFFKFYLSRLKNKTDCK